MNDSQVNELLTREAKKQRTKARCQGSEAKGIL